MKSDRSIFRTLLLLCMAAFVFASCDDDDDGSGDPGNGQNLVQIAGENTDLETFVTALQAANLTSAFEGTDQFTIFAPSNAAFAALGSEVDRLLEQGNEDELADILRYHVIEGRRLSTALQTNPEQATLLEFREIAITVGNDGSVTIGDSTDDDANVGTPNLEASNGVIHIIDKVLLPPNPSIAEIVTAAARDTGPSGLSTLLSILTLDELETLLNAASDESNPDALTVFAPTNAAFTALLGTFGLTLDDIRTELVQDIIRYHILPAKTLSTELEQQEATLLENESVTITTGDSGPQIDEANVEEADIEASNGVVHIIDGVLLPSPARPFADNVMGVAYFRDGFSTLIAALEKAELVDDLQADGSFTVFAPDDDAFTASGIESLDDLTKEELEPILLYHVIGGDQSILAGSLQDGGEQTTLNTANVYFSVNANGAFINGNTITGTDLPAPNGVVHTIDRVLLPPPGDIVDFVTADNQDGKYDALVAALTEAQLAGALDEPNGPFTVFAPSNEAFAALYATLDDADPNTTIDGPEDVEPGLLESVLLYHVVNGRTFSSDLSNGISVPTLSGPEMSRFTFTVNIGDSGVTITDGDEGNTDAGVGVGTDAELNQVATNGVIHDIDAVLLPPTAE